MTGKQEKTEQTTKDEPQIFWSLCDKDGKIWADFTRLIEQAPMDSFIAHFGEEGARKLAKEFELSTVEIEVKLKEDGGNHATIAGHLFSDTDTTILVGIGNGGVDAVRLARVQLALLGIGPLGEWIGLDEARESWGGESA